MATEDTFLSQLEDYFESQGWTTVVADRGENVALLSAENKTAEVTSTVLVSTSEDPITESDLKLAYKFGQRVNAEKLCVAPNESITENAQVKLKDSNARWIKRDEVVDSVSRSSPDVSAQTTTSDVQQHNSSTHAAVNCQRCGTDVEEWFCSYCGKERPMCPDCGAEMDDKQCKNCGEPRQAPCGECGLMIPATDQVCPHCEYNESSEVSEKSSGRKRKALGLNGVGIALFFIVGSMIPGPNIIGTIVGAIIALPPVSWGLLTAFYYSRKETKAQSLTAADVSKGREQNKTKEWREKEREKRKQMLQAGAQVASAAGEAASSYVEDKEKDRKINKLSNEKEKERKEKEQAKEENKELKKSPDLPSSCPRCGASWSGGILGGGNVERYSNGRKASCTECAHKELLFKK
jgi:hypothetical protein